MTISASGWLLYAVLLFAQSSSFTFVSRARNSASVTRHALSALLSNAIWFMSQAFTLVALTQLITGKAGWGWALFAGFWYSLWSVLGAIASHHWCLRSEKGKSRVGSYNDKPKAKRSQIACNGSTSCLCIKQGLAIGACAKPCNHSDTYSMGSLGKFCSDCNSPV